MRYLLAALAAALIRFAADTLPGVRARRCTVEPYAPANSQTVEPADITVTLKIAVASTLSIPETAATARERITAVINAQVALNPRHINVTVEDLYDV